MSKTYLCLLIFVTVVFALYNVIPKKFRWSVLLVSSYLLNCFISGYLVIYLAVTTVTVYLVSLWITTYTQKTDEKRLALPKEEKKPYREKCAKNKKLICAISVAVNFGILVVLKYSGFLVGSLNGIFGLDLEIPSFVVPLGISYYTLQAVGYTVDVCRGKYKADKNLARVALFVAYFPQLTEGPIGRYDHLAGQLYEGKSFSYENFTNGLLLALFGVFKKFVIADRANVFVSEVLSADSTYTGPYIIVGILMYTLLLYTEFSGFIDIVSGFSQMFGFELSKNFEQPFFSKSVSEFWRRWHITLGSWTRDYVFYPVSLSKPMVKLAKYVREHLDPYYASVIPNASALLVVWLFTGIWHGADIKYVVYGLYYYALMLMGMLVLPLTKKLMEKLKIKAESKIISALAIIRTLVFVNIGMLMFKCETLGMTFNMLADIFSSRNLPKFADLGFEYREICVLIVAVIILFTVEILQVKGHCVRELIAKRSIVLRWLIYIAFVMFIIIFGAYGDGYAAFDPIYAQF